ncbi:MAG TPA: MFS transporter [Terriglobales bacterium]|nr:MFS transporter [Terriglobales bacterium]
MRWVIAAWLTLSTILNLVDRQTLSILAPFLHDRFHLSTQSYSHVVTAFFASYTVMYAVGGRFVDWIGERVGMAACILWWSAFTMLTAVVQGAVSLGIVRFLLGLGEPANYPAALRSTTVWFPKSERGLGALPACDQTEAAASTTVDQLPPIKDELSRSARDARGAIAFGSGRNF